MFGNVAVGTRSIDEYRSVTSLSVIEELRQLAAPLEGVRVLHLSSPAASAGVRSLLQCSVPLMVNLGLRAQWQQLRMPAEFLQMDRQLRRALSGEPAEWTAQHAAEWTAFNLMNAHLFDEEFDVVVVHHTASVGLYESLYQVQGREPPGVWVWHSHRDYRTALPEAWGLIRQHASRFHVAAFDSKDFIRPDAPNWTKVVIPPGVDALGARAAPVANEIRDALLSQRGIDVERPILAEVISSVHPDSPLAVLDTFEMVKAYRPDVQLVVVNLAFTEGSELSRTVDLVTARAEKIGGVLHLTEVDKVGNVEISALRQEATVMVHQGFPKGLSMELLEEMWQSRSIVSNRSPMAMAAIQDGRNGLLTDSSMEQAEAVLRLLDTPKEVAKLGRGAHATVAKHFLVTHHLAAYLKLFQRVLGRTSTPSGH